MGRQGVVGDLAPVDGQQDRDDADVQFALQRPWECCGAVSDDRDRHPVTSDGEGGRCASALERPYCVCCRS